MIDAEMFLGWKDHPITKAVYKRLQEVKENICDEMQDEHVIMSVQSSKRLAYLAGERKSIEMIFELSIEDIYDEESKSSRV